ncbi:MAG: alpha-E domain-containing protein [Rhodocyclaceae bacterium]
MLSRTADHLYWMARYTERAENVARMLDVTYRVSLLPNYAANPEKGWGAALSISGLEEAYAERYGKVTPENILRFMVMDPANPVSIFSCLRSARENGHAVRGTLTSEMWEILNTTWLNMRSRRISDLGGAEMTDLFEWVKLRSHLSRGVTVGTMLQDEAFQFIRLGTFLERADNTARILDVKYDALLPSAEDQGGAADYYEWGALLRSVSAFVIYRRVYRDMITPKRVAELLILREDMPRSLHACMNEVHAILALVANDHSGETERRAGELHAALHYGRIEDIVRVGMHDYLTDFLGRIRDLGSRIADDFLLPVTD